MDFIDHAPVMLDEAIGALLGTARSGASTRPGATYVDATFGAGGYTRAILARDPESRVVAIDVDLEACGRAQTLAGAYPGRVIPVHANFADLDRALEIAGVSAVDGVVYDLGLSSMQLAEPARGFGFGADAPLDMRLDPSAGPTAADLLATRSERELATILYIYGDERHARRIARQIVLRRERSPLRRTSDLVAAVISAQPAGSRRRHARIHPATRAFQALRIATNDELRSLERGLAAAIERCKPGGRIVVVSFHSGEDRIVKRTFNAWRASGAAKVLTPSPRRPSAAEIQANPRSRSAKLRAAEKIGDDVLAPDQTPKEAA